MRIALAALAFAFANTCSGQPSFVPLPSSIEGGKQGLEGWISENVEQYLAQLESIPLNGGELAIVYYSTGSGIHLLDIYVYGCTTRDCLLLARISGVSPEESNENPILARVDEQESELTLSNGGTVILRINLPNDH